MIGEVEIPPEGWEIDDRLRALEVPPAEPAAAPLPEGWTINEDGDACLHGEIRAMINVLDDVAFVADQSRLPRVPLSVVRALLAISALRGEL